jgi:hypothetical protein
MARITVFADQFALTDAASNLKIAVAPETSYRLRMSDIIEMGLIIDMHFRESREERHLFQFFDRVSNYRLLFIKNSRIRYPVKINN